MYCVHATLPNNSNSSNQAMAYAIQPCQDKAGRVEQELVIWSLTYVSFQHKYGCIRDKWSGTILVDLERMEKQENRRSE